jgi:hypothetical protein
MKSFCFVFLLFIMSSARAEYQAPEILEKACANHSCTPEMEAIYNSFLSTPHAPQYMPGMYSGICYHQSEDLDPKVQHYIGLLLDRHPQGFYMAPIFQYFGDHNDMADQSLADARKETSSDWKNYGPMKIHPTSATQFVADSDGNPVYIYWARQNLETKTIYFLAVARGFSVAFCEAHPNVNGLE